MIQEAAIRIVLPAKKGTERHTKHLVSISVCYLGHLDGIPKSDPLTVSYPLKNNKGSVQSSVAVRTRLRRYPLFKCIFIKDQYPSSPINFKHPTHVCQKELIR